MTRFVLCDRARALACLRSRTRPVHILIIAYYWNLFATWYTLDNEHAVFVLWQNTKKKSMSILDRINDMISWSENKIEKHNERRKHAANRMRFIMKRKKQSPNVECVVQLEKCSIFFFAIAAAMKYGNHIENSTWNRVFVHLACTARAFPNAVRGNNCACRAQNREDSGKLCSCMNGPNAEWTIQIRSWLAIDP